MIVSVVAVLIAVASLGMSLALLQRVQALSLQLDAARRTQAGEDRDAPVLKAPAVRPLEGLRVILAVSQDHPHPVFAGLLKERLLREDIASVEEFGGSPADAVGAWNSRRLDADLLVAGGLTCNGYADVYYQAEFTCYSPADTVCRIAEKPTGGDRPENLALEIVSVLGSRLEELVQRNERRRAIAELHGP